jgi:hypothetical protein
MAAPTSVRDLDGKLVEVGDRIAYSAADGDSAGLRIGVVRAIVETEPHYHFQSPAVKLKVEVDLTSGWSLPSRATTIAVARRTFVKL